MATETADERTTVQVTRSTRDELRLVAVDMSATERKRLNFNETIRRLIEAHRAAVAGKVVQ